jgi:hypothetical protein
METSLAGKIDIAPIIDVDGVCASQMPAAGGEQELLIDGALAVDGVVTFDIPHLIDITSDADDSGRTFVITGTKQGGAPLTETISPGPNPTVSSTSYFKTVTSITIDANSTGNITVGVNGLAATGWIPSSVKLNPTNIGFGCTVAAGSTLTYSVQKTFSDLEIVPDSEVNVFEHPTVTGETATAEGSFTTGFYAFRLAVTAFTTGSIEFEYVIAGQGA